MTDETKTRVANATVRLPDLGGLGVLIPGGFIGTACHCVEWVGTGMMALGMEYPANVVTADGTKFRLGVAAADPVSDMAVLTDLDNPEADADCVAFEQWRERVEPIPLSHLMLRWQESCPVLVLSHKGKWINGTVTRHSLPTNPMPNRVAVHTEEQIECGTSGGPVVTEDGQLVGIISASGGDSTELMPVAHLALPRWVLDKMVWVPDEEEIDRVRGIFAQAAAGVKVHGKRRQPARRKPGPEEPEILLPGDPLLVEQANIVADHINHADFRNVRRDARARVIALWDAGLVTANQAAGFERLLGETLSERRRQMRRAG